MRKIKNYVALTIKRHEELPTDAATSFDAIKHTIENTKKYDYVVLLQPSNPSRNEKHIDEAIELHEEKNADAIVSVCEMDHLPLCSNTLDDSLSMNNFLKDEVKNKRSQDLSQYHRLNGAIYICKINKLFAYKMGKESSVGINIELDYRKTSILLKKQNKEGINY